MDQRGASLLDEDMLPTVRGAFHGRHWAAWGWSLRGSGVGDGGGGMGDASRSLAPFQRRVTADATASSP